MFPASAEYTYTECQNQRLDSMDLIQGFLPIGKDIEVGLSVLPDCLLKEKHYLKWEFLSLRPFPIQRKNRQCVQCGVEQHTKWHH